MVFTDSILVRAPHQKKRTAFDILLEKLGVIEKFHTSAGAKIPEIQPKFTQIFNLIRRILQL